MKLSPVYKNLLSLAVAASSLLMASGAQAQHNPIGSDFV